MDRVIKMWSGATIMTREREGPDKAEKTDLKQKRVGKDLSLNPQNLCKNAGLWWCLLGSWGKV